MTRREWAEYLTLIGLCLTTEVVGAAPIALLAGGGGAIAATVAAIRVVGR